MQAKNTFFISVGAVILAVALGITGAFYLKLKNASENNQLIAEEVADNQSPFETPAVDTQTQPGPNDFPENFDIQNLTSSLGGEKIVVDWYKGAKPATEEEYQKIIYSHDPWMKEINDRKENKCLEIIPKEQPLNRFPCPVYLYQAGVIKSPKAFAGQTLYFALVGIEEMGFAYWGWYGVYSAETDKLIVLVDDKGEVGSLNSNEFGRFVSGYIASGQQVGFFNYPKIIDADGYDFLLSWSEPFDADLLPFSFGGTALNQGGVYDAAKNGVNDVYEPKNKIVSGKDGTPVYFVDGTFRVQLADGAIHLYDLIPYFFETEELLAGKEYFSNSFTTDIGWTKNNNKKDKYILGGDIKLSCGMYVDTLTNVVDKKDWFSEKKLVEIGKTKKGEKIYELFDKKTNPLYKQLFDYGYEATLLEEAGGSYDSEIYERLKQVPEEEKFSKFLSDTPIFFWQDDFGNWRVYFKSKYRSLAECGKPVIYLYPEKEMDVKVRVAPNGGFTKTEPAYNNGWVVRATPQSDLFNYADKTNYPYLFWEGKAYGFSIDSTRGFVMAKADVGAEMTRILGKLGLNEKETKDFLEFWQPKLEVKPYVFVTFVPQNEFNKAAPLAVNPRPGTIIRVFMDYTPLDALIDVAPLSIQTPERRGFTVVEWGGRLH